MDSIKPSIDACLGKEERKDLKRINEVSISLTNNNLLSNAYNVIPDSPEETHITEVSSSL